MRRDPDLLSLGPLIGVFAACLASPLAAAPQIEDVVIEVDGRTVHALCTDGPRRVALLPGDTGGAASWRPVLQRLADRVGACAYDLPLAAPGEPVGERGWFELLDEMRRVHSALGLEPGFTLVGHSVGGLYARLFASDRPLDAGGLVLVEPSHEDMPKEARPGMPETAWAAWMERRARPNSDGVREADLARHASRSRLPDIPVTVLTATERESGPGWNERFVAEAARRVHSSVLHGVRWGRHVPAQGSGVLIHLEAPGLVAGEIARMARMTNRTGGL